MSLQWFNQCSTFDIGSGLLVVKTNPLLHPFSRSDTYTMPQHQQPQLWDYEVLSKVLLAYHVFLSTVGVVGGMRWGGWASGLPVVQVKVHMTLMCCAIDSRSGNNSPPRGFRTELTWPVQSWDQNTLHFKRKAYRDMSWQKQYIWLIMNHKKRRVEWDIRSTPTRQTSKHQCGADSLKRPPCWSCLLESPDHEV